MATYVATLFAKQGSEEEVTRFYQELEPLLRAAPGFRHRTMLRAQPGKLFEVVKPMLSEADLAGNREPPHPEGVQFVMIEEWDTPEDRVRFSRSQDKSRAAKLYPHLHGHHTHEFFEDVTPRD